MVRVATPTLPEHVLLTLEDQQAGGDFEWPRVIWLHPNHRRFYGLGRGDEVEYHLADGWHRIWFVRTLAVDEVWWAMPGDPGGQERKTFVAPAAFSVEAAEVYVALRRDGVGIVQAKAAARRLAA